MSTIRRHRNRCIASAPQPPPPRRRSGLFQSLFLRRYGGCKRVILHRGFCIMKEQRIIGTHAPQIVQLAVHFWCIYKLTYLFRVVKLHLFIFNIFVTPSENYRKTSIEISTFRWAHLKIEFYGRSCILIQ